ncbi:MAG: HEAT repeat domain-containing protein [Thermoguttaceae bacterium]
MNAIERLNTWGAGWSAFMAVGLVDATVMLALMGLIWLVLRRWASPQLGCWLFLLVLVRLVVPIEVTVPEPLARLSPQRLLGEFLPRQAQPDLRVKVSPSTMEPVVEFSDPPMDRFDDDLALESAPPSAEIVLDTNVSANEVEATSGPAVRLSLPAKLMIGWALIVLGLLGLLARSQWKTVRLLRRTTPIDPATLPVDWADLKRRAGLRRPIRLARSSDVSGPAVWGLLRPGLLLPDDFLTTTAGRMRWVLLHELAHLRRGDLWISLFQRLVQLVYFFHPAVWVANWMIDRQREFACDDVALEGCEASRRESGAAFLSIVERSNRRFVPLEPVLGIFRSSQFFRRRLVRILDKDRPIRVRLGLASTVLLLLTALVLLPHLRAAEKPARVVDTPQPPIDAPETSNSDDNPTDEVPPKVRELIEQLTHTEPQKRADAAKELGVMGKWSVAAIPALARAMHDDAAVTKNSRDTAYSTAPDISGIVGYEAAAALAKIGGPAVPVLVEAMSDEDWRVRRLAARLVARTQDARAADPLIAALDDSDTRVRAAALRGLFMIEDPKAVVPLTHVLHDKTVAPEDRRSAVSALSRRESPAAVEALLLVLQDREDDENVRSTAAFWLASGEHRRAIEPLIAILDDPRENNRVRMEAARVLGGFGDHRATDSLLGALKHEDENIRHFAGGSLYRLKDPRAFGPLVDVLEEGEPTSAAWAARTLGELGNPQAIPTLTDALHAADKSVRAAAVGALGRIGTLEATAPLVTALADKEPEVRKAAVKTLGEVKPSDLTERMIAALEDDDASVRDEATKVLGKLNDTRAIRPLIAALERDVADGGRCSMRLVSTLGEFRAVDAVEPLIAALETNVGAWAAEALGKIGDRRAARPLVAILDDETGWVRSLTAKALGQINDRSIVPDLLATLEEDDPSARFGALVALGHLGHARALEPLIHALDLRNGRPWMDRYNAAQALGHIDDSRAVDALLTAIDDKHDGLVSLALVYALGVSGDPRALGPLVDILENHQILHYRIEAARALGTLDNHQAVAPLQKALNDEYEGVMIQPGEKELFRHEIRRALARLGIKRE